MIGKLITELKAKQADLAEAAMMFPKSDPFEHGCQCGRYQGIQLALDAIDSILRDEIEKERKS